MLAQILKNSIRLLPGGDRLSRLGSSIRRRRLAGRDPAEVFETIYRTNAWACRESVSGPGSTMAETATLRAALPGVLRSHAVTSILDVPCGDFNWMRAIDLTGVTYLGADIVTDLIEANRRAYARSGVQFERLDLLCDPLPRADLVIVRDCLVHFSDGDAARALTNIVRSESALLLITTHRGQGPCAEIATGQWRPLDLEAPPFGLPTPISVIEEPPADGSARGKAMGLWQMDTVAAALETRPDGSASGLTMEPRCPST